MARYKKFHMGFHCEHIPQFIFDMDELVRNIDYLTHRQVKGIAEDFCMLGRSKMRTHELRKSVVDELMRADGTKTPNELFADSQDRLHLPNINRVWTVNELRSEWNTIQQYTNSQLF